MTRLEQIREKYLAGQNTLDFTQQGGSFIRYAQLVFSGQVFGPGQDVTDTDLGIFNAEDLTNALLLLNEHDTDDLVRGY